MNYKFKYKINQKVKVTDLSGKEWPNAIVRRRWLSEEYPIDENGDKIEPSEELFETYEVLIFNPEWHCGCNLSEFYVDSLSEVI